MRYALCLLAGLALGVAATVVVMTPHLLSEQEAEARFLVEARQYFDEQLPLKRAPTAHQTAPASD